jgi:hypothetical protein
MTIKFNKFSPEKVHFTDLEENKRSKGQKIAYVRYGESTPFLQTPKIQLSTYGIPRPGEYYKEDSQRSFIKVPLDVGYSDEVKLFHDKLVKLDKILDSDAMREKIFGSKKAAKGWKYQPIVREAMKQTLGNSDSDSEDDSGEPKQEPFRPPYFKAKLKTKYETGAIETKVFKKVDGERMKEKLNTLSELEKLVTYRSTIRLVLMPNKLWAMKNYDGKRYGLALKIMHLEVEPITRSSLKDYCDGDAFLDSDDEEGNKVQADDEDDDVADDVSMDSSVLKTSALDGNDSDDSEDSDSDSDSEEEEKVVKKKTTKKASKKKSKTKSATSSA